MRTYPKTAPKNVTSTNRRSFSWTEMDEQMAREGQARINSMQSIGHGRRSTISKDQLKPGQGQAVR